MWGQALGGVSASTIQVPKGSQMKKWSAVLPLSLVAVACSQQGQVAQRIPADSSQYFRTQVEQMTTVAAAKDVAERGRR